jgi:hypothetical protein
MVSKRHSSRPLRASNAFTQPRMPRSPPAVPMITLPSK